MKQTKHLQRGFVDVLGLFLIVGVLVIGATLMSHLLKKAEHGDFDFPPQEETVGAGQSPVILTANMTQATSTVSTTRVKLLDANSGRQYTRVDMGPNSTTNLYLYLTNASTSVIAQGGIPLSATTTRYFVIDETDLYTGEIWAIADGSQTVYVTTN